MKKISNLFILMLIVLQYSCIDRDTIAGTGKEDPDSIIGAGGNFQFGIVNSKLITPLKVRVLAANGRPVRGIIVEFSVENRNAVFSDTNAVTNSDGYAQTTVTLGAKADSVRINASVLGLKGSPVKFTLLATSSNASFIEMVSGDNQTNTVASKLLAPLSVKVSDLYNNPIKNAIIYFSTPNGSVNPNQVLTDSSGLAQSEWTLDTTIGNKKAQAIISSVENGVITFNAVAISLLEPYYFQRISTDTIVSLAGTTNNNIFRVKVLDKYKNPIYRNGIFSVQFSVKEGFGTVTQSKVFTNKDGEAASGFELTGTDSILKVSASVGFGLPDINFIVFAYKYLQIDSLKSNGGIVTIYWQKNRNPYFSNYTLQRCNNYNFDNTTVDVKVISDENITSTDDNTAAIGTSPFYRLRVNYSNGFYFYTNLRDVLVKP